MKNSAFAAYIDLITSAILFGLLVFGGKLMSLHGFSLLQIIILPGVIVVICLIWFVKDDFRRFYSFPWWIVLLYPLSSILIQLGQFAPLFLGLSVSLTVFLLYTQPLWTILFSTVFLRSKFTRQDGIVTLIMFSGLVLLLKPWENLSFSAAGFTLAVLGGAGLSGWIILNSSVFIPQGIKPLSLTFFENLYASLPFLLAYPLIAHFTSAPGIIGFSLDKPYADLIAVVFYSLTVYIAAQVLFYNAAKSINNVVLGLVLLLEPAVAAILDVSFLGTVLTWNIACGGLLIIGTNIWLILSASDRAIRK